MHPSVINVMKLFKIIIFMTITEGRNFSSTSLRDKLTSMLKVFTAHEITKYVNTVVPCFQFKILLKWYVQKNNLKVGF